MNIADSSSPNLANAVVGGRAGFQETIFKLKKI
jgi:hypothetical protein